jgi:adenylylsulfate kinase
MGLPMDPNLLSSHHHNDHLTPLVVITGPVGAGKSTVAKALTDLLAEHAVCTAMVDMDYLRWLYPPHPEDRFSSRLGFRNLAAIWPNLLNAGATSVVLADVVEDMVQRETYQSLMPGSTVIIVRLNVPLDLILERLATRESGTDLEWHRSRAPELQTIMERAGVGDLVIDVGSRLPLAVATEIAIHLNLIPPSHRTGYAEYDGRR